MKKSAPFLPPAFNLTTVHLTSLASKTLIPLTFFRDKERGCLFLHYISYGLRVYFKQIKGDYKCIPVE